MDVCSRTPNRTEPAVPVQVRDSVPLCSRTNGWSWPPHPFQLLAWGLYVFFAVTGFGVFVPLLPPHWIPAGYICTGVMFVCHLCVHVLAVSVDPADRNVRLKSERGPLPVFDRSKHAHVIENCHCYLCEVDVGSKSKHCSSCNKCVADFDHHCRWLNNCVGSRNYRLFLHSVLSALLGVFLVLLLASYVFIEFFIDPNKLRTDQHFQVRNDSGVWFVFLPVAPLRSAAGVIPGLAAVTIGLGLLSSVLLSHLLGFHIYLMWNRLSTYEYIVRQRHRLDRKPANEATTRQDVKNSSRILRFTNQEEAEGSAVSNVIKGEDEAPPTFSSAAAHSKRYTQKKKKRRIPAELRGGQAPPSVLAPPPLLAPPPGLVLPSDGAPPVAFPVQAAAPPAEYHSDSAESLEEIPVVMARLGSTAHRGPRGPSSRLNRTNVAPQPLSVFMTRASGGPSEPWDHTLTQGPRQPGSRPGPGSWPGSRASLGSGAAMWTER